MTLNSDFCDTDDVLSIDVDRDIYRQLIQQFHESSIQRYGADSEQSQMFELHLAAHMADAA